MYTTSRNSMSDKLDTSLFAEKVLYEFLAISGKPAALFWLMLKYIPNKEDE